MLPYSYSVGSKENTKQPIFTMDVIGYITSKQDVEVKSFIEIVGNKRENITYWGNGAIIIISRKGKTSTGI